MAAGASGLQPAFHIHHLMEIKDAIEKLKEPKKVSCGKCIKSPQQATSYCRDCGEFICSMCTTVHNQWNDFVNHDVIAIEQLEQKIKQLDALKKVALYCSLHKGKGSELYCETCGELICHNCTVKKHKNHKYDLVEDIFEKHKAKITASLEPVENQLGAVSKALMQFDLRLQELDDLQVAIEDNIRQQIKQLQELLEARKAELINQVQQYIQTKKKNLATQKDEVETVHARLASCLSFVRESLRTGSQGEVMKMKKVVVKQIKEMTDNFKPDMLPPCELANVRFILSPNFTQACQQFGEVYLQQVFPEKCSATGKGLEVAKLGERTTAVLHVVDQKGMVCATPVENLTCELVSEITGKKIDCSVKKTTASQYEISYQATGRRRQLHIKVERKHIKGSPFSITVKLPVQMLGTPMKAIDGVKCPWGVAVNKREEVIIAENSGHCISIFSRTGGKIRSFGSQGSAHGQFNSPRGVAVDDSGNILVVDENNHRIQKFTTKGKFITTVGKQGDKNLEFNEPMGITINQKNKKIYVTDEQNHRIQILNPDLTFSGSFGSHGSDNRQFKRPWDVACDSAGNVYVADNSNHRIQVFTAEGEFLNKFGRYGRRNGELHWPSSISIDTDNMVYVTEEDNHRVSVFTCEGKFLTSYGTEGNGPRQFSGPRGMVVDKNGVVYVSDTNNNRLQLF